MTEPAAGDWVEVVYYNGDDQRNLHTHVVAFDSDRGLLTVEWSGPEPAGRAPTETTFNIHSLGFLSYEVRSSQP